MNANAILDSESPDSNLEQSTVPIKYSFINQGSYKKSKSPYLNSFLSSKESRENKFFTSKSSEINQFDYLKGNAYTFEDQRQNEQKVNRSLQFSNRMNYSSQIIENNSSKSIESRNGLYDYSNNQRLSENIIFDNYQQNSRNNMKKWRTDFNSELNFSKDSQILPSQNRSSRYCNLQYGNKNSGDYSNSKSSLFMLDETLRRLHERKNLNNMRKSVALAVRLEIAEQINKKLKFQKREKENVRMTIELENLRIKDYKKLNPPK